MIPLVVGCPVWDRSWCLDLWFDSLTANVDPDATGLVFVVPPNDMRSREVITQRAREFAWLEVLRDRNEQFDRVTRIADNHRSLAAARNQILYHVHGASPAHYLSWDSDLLLPPRTVGRLLELRATEPACHVQTVWTWLNRAKPSKGHRALPNSSKFEPVLYQEPMAATAMQWEADNRAVHFDPADWDRLASGHWKCDVALAVQLMSPEAYRVARYLPHPHGEDIPFNWELHQRGLGRFCLGESVGVHLFERGSDREASRGYHEAMKLAEQRPLAADRREPRHPVDEALGYFPKVRT